MERQRKDKQKEEYGAENCSKNIKKWWPGERMLDKEHWDQRRHLFLGWRQQGKNMRHEQKEERKYAHFTSHFLQE